MPTLSFILPGVLFQSMSAPGEVTAFGCYRPPRSKAIAGGEQAFAQKTRDRLIVGTTGMDLDFI
jgi:hypothetical protein